MKLLLDDISFAIRIEFMHSVDSLTEPIRVLWTQLFLQSINQWKIPARHQETTEDRRVESERLLW